MKEEYKALNFYKHRIQISIEGFRTDKLLAAAFSKDIALKNVRPVSETRVIAWISYKDLKKLKKLAKSVYKITIIKEEGPESKIKSMKKKPVLFMGIVIAAAIVFLRASFISEIVIDGYRAIPEQSLRQCLNEAGIYEGAYRPSVEWEKAKASIFKTFPQVTWARLVYDGMVVYLDIAETDDLPEKDREGPADVGNAGTAENTPIKYVDLVAVHSGYIESIQPLWGEARVEAGDYVKKGQILIDGEIPIEPTTFEEGDPDRYYVRACGEVWARVPYRLNFAQERYIEPARSDSEGSETGEKILIANKRERTDEEIKKKAEQQIRLWMKENLPENAEIINKSLNFRAKENIIEVGVTIEVRCEITKEQERSVGQKTSDNRRN